MLVVNTGSRGLDILLLVVLARLLSPQDFGLMGIALLVYAALERVSQLGLDKALIHRVDEDVDGYLDTTWLLQLARGGLLAGVVYLGAPAAAQFFGEPRVLDLLRVLAVSPLLVGLRNPGVVYFRKRLEFHREVAFQLSGTVTYFAVTLALAVALRDVWALVVGYVVRDAVFAVASYLLHDYRPSVSYDHGVARELVDYGKWITASGLVYFLVEQGDDVVVGWVLTAVWVGYYQLAYRLANTPTTEITNVIATVMFPTYARLQDDVPQLRETFYRTTSLVTFVTFPMAAGIVTVAPVFVRGALGPEWVPMVGALQLVAVYGMFLSLAASFGPLWHAVGRPDYPTKIGAGRVAFMAVFLVPATNQYGIEGTAAVVIAAYLVVGLPADAYLLVSSLETTYRRVLRTVSYPLAASGGMALVVYAVRERLAVGNALAEFLALVLLGVVAYLGLVYVLERGFQWGIESDIRSVVAAARG
jgi:PST family polysaccharide transporter/lipopolysaccharide exporter